ncbi:MAG: S8 family peptidase [Synechococcales bacterium]|nr:S8 family peptidase [Synechococcales bacterium]
MLPTQSLFGQDAGVSPSVKSRSVHLPKFTAPTLSKLDSGLSGNLHAFPRLRSRASLPSQFFYSRSQEQFRATNTPTLGSRGMITGSLDTTDPQDANQDIGDSYQLVDVARGQQVHIQLSSPEFDTLLQVVDARTGRVLLEDDDTEGSNSRLTFVVQPRVTYQIRVTSFNGSEVGNYTLTADTFQPRSIRNYGFTYGYGLVDAAAAVEKAATRRSTKPSPKSTDRWLEESNPGWGAEYLDVMAPWSDGYLGKDVVVAVLDTGVDYRHPALRRGIWKNADEVPNNGLDDDGNGYIDDVRGWDFAANDADPMDTIGHGTQVSGIIAARNQPGGTIGVAPRAKIMPIKVLGDDGDGNQDSIEAGIRYAIDNGAKVINMSLGAEPGYQLSPSFVDALRLARKKGVSIVIAAGNERQELGATQPGEPAFFASSHRMGIAVGAVNQFNRVEDFSNPTGNRKLDFVVAPGADIRSILPATETRSHWWDGTSMAAPHVAGVVALMLDANPKLKPRQITKILTKTATRDLISERST